MIPTVLATVDVSKNNIEKTVSLNDSVDNYKAIAILGEKNREYEFKNGYIRQMSANAGYAPPGMAIMSVDYLKKLSDYINAVVCCTWQGSNAFLKIKYVDDTTIKLANENAAGAYFISTKIIGLN